MILSKFQLATIATIEKRPDFDKFIVPMEQRNVYDVVHVKVPHHSGSGCAPYTVLWVDLKGNEHKWRLGVRKLLSSFTRNKSHYPEHVI